MTDFEQGFKEQVAKAKVPGTWNPLSTSARELLTGTGYSIMGTQVRGYTIRLFRDINLFPTPTHKLSI